jgi:hypothetical protein
MKLGFVDQVIREEGFYNLTLNGRTVGVNIDLGLNYYRGLAVSCIEKLEVAIDGQVIAPELMLFNLEGKKWSVDKLPLLFEEYWGIKKTAHLQIFNNGLTEGEHEVKVTLQLRNPYMKFAPLTYGGVDSSCSKRIVLKEVRELC